MTPKIPKTCSLRYNDKSQVPTGQAISLPNEMLGKHLHEMSSLLRESQLREAATTRLATSVKSQEPDAPQ